MTHLNTQIAARHKARACIVTLLLAMSAGSALAESPGTQTEAFVSSRTRAEVLAELAAFKKSGVNPWSIGYQPTHHLRSNTTREAVQMEAIASRETTTALGAEDSGAVYLLRKREPGSVAALLAVQASEAP